MKKAARQALAAEQYASMSAFDQAYINDQVQLVAGVDEAGRGPLAGPLVAAACILDYSQPLIGLNDSKKLSAARRDYFYQQITQQALAWSVALVDAPQIDELNILQATKLAMDQAISQLQPKPDFILLDAVSLDQYKDSSEAIVKGDSKSLAIAAASIIAKVTRDRIMLEYDRLYPDYGFARHKGYGTKHHYQALAALGLSPIHRLTFLKNLSDRQLKP